MGKRILRVYLAKNDTPYSAAYAKLEMPASPWEVWDAMEKVRLQTDDILYMEVEDYYAFEYLSPHLDGLDISLNELNDLAAQLAALDEVQGIAFEGMFSIEVQRKVNANGGIITLQDLRDLAVSAKTDCYHVVDAADDAALGRFYAENDFIPELDGVSDAVFKMLDFAGIGRMMRHGENGVFVGNLYVLRDGELTTAPPVQKTLPEKPGYLFRLTLGLHPDIGDARTVTLDLPAAEAELLDAQAQLGVEGWEGVTVMDYDGIIPYAAEFTDLPMELEELNAFTKAARDIPRSEVPKLKALLEQFEVQDIETAMLLTEHLADYILTPNLSSPQEAALDQLCFIMDREEAVRLIPYVNLFNYKFFSKGEFTDDYLQEEMDLTEVYLKPPDAEAIRALMLERAPRGSIRRAADFFKLIRYSFSGGAKSFGGKPCDIRRFFHLIWECSRRLANVIVENKDFEEVIRQYDRAGAVIYCDPPYYKAEGCYEVEFPPEDHQRLHDALVTCEGYFIVSYNYQDYICELYQDCYIFRTSRPNSMSQTAGSEYEEIVITNYDPRKACWQLSMDSLLGGDGDTRYELVHEPEHPLKI